jgi:hypothetical protein
MSPTKTKEIKINEQKIPNNKEQIHHQEPEKTHKPIKK